MTFVDVKNDVAFRKIFGNDNRKEVLISFLNAILGFEEGQRITKVTIVNPFQLPNLSREGKTTIIDVKAKDQSGREFIVEMQVADTYGFDKRVMYYVAKSYSSQIKRGEDFIKLKPAFFIGILEFNHTKNKHYISRNQVRDIETGEQTIKDVEFTFIELPKFKLKINQLTNLTEKWIYFIKNAENLNVIPDDVDDKGLKSAYEEANIQTWTDNELDAYEKVFIRAEVDRNAARKKMDQAVENALATEIPKAVENALATEIPKAVENALATEIPKAVENALATEIPKAVENALATEIPKAVENALEMERINSVLVLFKNGISPELISVALNISKKQIDDIIQSNN